MKLASLIIFLLLAACSVVQQQKVENAFSSTYKDFPKNSTKIKIEKCHEKDLGVNPNCRNEANHPDCPEPKELESCEFVLNVSKDGCFHWVRAVEKCDEGRCKYIFGFYGLSVCN